MNYYTKFPILIAAVLWGGLPFITFASAGDIPIQDKPFLKVSLDKEYDFSPQSRGFGEQEGERFATACDKKTRESLIVILGDKESDEDYDKGKLAFFLGKTKDSEVCKTLISCLERWLSVPVTGKSNGWIRCAILGLGFLSDSQAFAYLQNLAMPEYWEQLPAPIRSETEDTAENLVRWYRENAAYAIGASGTQQAAEILSRMETDPKLADLKGAIFTAKMDNQSRITGAHLEERKKRLPVF